MRGREEYSFYRGLAWAFAISAVVIYAPTALVLWLVF